MKVLFVPVIVTIITFVSSTAFSGQCSVLEVLDGDTVSLSCPDYNGNVNIFGIDAPEKGQLYWKESKEKLSDILDYKNPSFEVNKSKHLVMVFYSGGSSLSAYMVLNGFAWSIDRNDNQENLLLRLEKKARKKGKNIWSEDNVMSPWDYRKKNHISSDLNKIFHSVISSIGGSGSGGGGKPSLTYDDCGKMEDSIEEDTCRMKVMHYRNEEYSRVRTQCSGTTEQRIECKGENLKKLKMISDKYKM